MHITADLAYRMARPSDEEVKAEVTEVLCGIYGPDVPQPNKIVSMPWGLDESFLGSFSYSHPGGMGGLKELRKPIRTALYCR